MSNNYQSPFHLFTPTQLEQFDHSQLSIIKKAILHPFQLNEDYQLRSGLRQYNLEEVLAVFAVLEKDAQLHFEIFNNKPLLGLLESGKVNFFRDPYAQATAVQHAGLSNEIEERIANATRPILNMTLSSYSTSNMNILKQIHAYYKDVSLHYSDLAYVAFFENMESSIANLKTQFTDPFDSPVSTKFDADIHTEISLVRYSYFNHLPTSLSKYPHGLKLVQRDYAKWCNDQIIYQLNLTDINISEVSRKTLISIITAAEIASNYFNQTQNNQLRTLLKPLLHNKKVESSRRIRPSNNKIIALVASLLFLILCFIGYQIVAPFANSSEEAMDFNEDIGRDQSSFNNTEISRGQSDLYNGGNFNITKPVPVSIVDHIRYIELTYSLVTIPTLSEGFLIFLPDEFIDAHDGQSRLLKLNFNHKYLPGVSFSHLIDATFNGKRTQLIHQTSNVDDYENHTIRTKKMALSTNEVHGHHSVVNRDHTTSDLFPFSIIYQKESKVYEIRYDNKIYSITKDRVEDLWTPANDMIIRASQEQFFATIIKFSQMIHWKQLKIGRYYRIDDVYIPIPASDQSEMEHNIKRSKGYLNYYMASHADEVSYCSIKGVDFNIKYFFDQKTGSMLGMQFAMFNSAATYLERIELFIVQN